MSRSNLPRTGNPAVVQCAGAPDLFGPVYAIGQIRHYFPGKDIFKLFCQLDDSPASNPEIQRLQTTMQKYPFFAREMGWLFQIQDVDTYVVIPRTPVELNYLITNMYVASVAAGTQTFDLIVGVLSPGELERGGSDLPAVVVDVCDQFTLAQLVADILKELPASTPTLPTAAQITELFGDVLQLADNTGDSDEQRALNYVCRNYPEFYIPQYGPGAQAPSTSIYFAGVSARRSPLGAGRTVIDVVLRYENHANGITSAYYTSVDVTGKYPFLVTQLQPYYER